MEENKKPTKNQEPQQRPEDAEKQNAQQEREYRKQKAGTIKNPTEQFSPKKSREKFEKIVSDDKKDPEKKEGEKKEGEKKE